VARVDLPQEIGPARARLASAEDAAVEELHLSENERGRLLIEEVR